MAANACHPALHAVFPCCFSASSKSSTFLTKENCVSKLSFKMNKLTVWLTVIVAALVVLLLFPAVRIIFFLTLATAMDQPLTYVVAAIFGALVGAFIGWRSGGNTWKGARSGMLLFQVLLFLVNVLYVLSALSDPASFSFIQ
jgi:hypothetical protein